MCIPKGWKYFGRTPKISFFSCFCVNIFTQTNFNMNERTKEGYFGLEFIFYIFIHFTASEWET